jgi:hypothetical protein
LIAAVIGGAFALPTVTSAESQEEQPINDVLEAAVDARFASDFPRLVSLIHPATLRLFRNQLSASFDQLLRSYSLGQIASVSGLPDHPKNPTLSDSEFFVFACNNAKTRHPDFVGDPKYLPCNIHGSIFDNDKIAHVVLAYSGAVHTEHTDFDFVQPFVVTFRREQSKWLVYSCPLARGIGDNWWRDLARSRNVEVN